MFPLFTEHYFSLQHSLKSLSRKAFLHVDAQSGFNRLQAAVFQGDYDTVLNAEWLLEDHVQHMNFQKTGRQTKEFPGKTALEILHTLQEKGEGNVGIEKMYKEYVEKINKLSELHLCRGSDDAEKAVELVLNDGVDIDIPGKSNRTPLMWACTSASGEFIKTLIDLGADVNARRPDDNVTPLIVAAFFNNYQAVNILLNHGAKVDIQDNKGERPSHDSAKGGYFNVFKLLMDSGCKINVGTNNEETPLYLAVKNKHVHVVKYILESKADVIVKCCKENVGERIYLVCGKDRAGKSAWHYVLVKKALLPLFLRRTNGGSLNVATFGQVLKSGRRRSPPESVREEMREMEKTFPDVQGVTILHVACKSAIPEIVDMLAMKCKEDVNACDGEGYTPLHLAAMHGSIQVVKKLVELNADINLKVDGKDAADLARMNEETEIEEFLKSKRSSPLKDSDI